MIDKGEIISLLQMLGLGRSEALIYMTLLELNEAAPSVIAKKSGLKRPTCYLTLEKLVEKGLASSVRKKKILVYRATKPDLFLENERKKAKLTETSIEQLSKSLPELLSLHHKFTVTPQMSVFYGKEGLIQVMEDTLTTKGELLCWGDVEEGWTSRALKEYYPKYIKKKVARKIWLRGVFSYSKTALLFQERGKKELREVYLIPRDEFMFRNEINIYDDKVAIISHEDEVGIIIQNKHIADTQRTIFKIGFEFAKRTDLGHKLKNG